MTGPEDELERRLRAETIPPPNPVMDAMDAYRAKFGTTPWMIHIPADLMPAWVEAIHGAIRAGRPLDEADLERVTGLRMPPPGASS